ncbi:MAG: cell envelope protein SmpA [Caulobacterales bacterium 32-69-10]|nr:MAG: cell envelope protein SmpA [Caulobacterales bacterium 32-69-10]
MASKPLILLAALCLAGAGAAACSPTVAYNGFQAREDKPQDVKVGEDTKSTVLARLGSASTTATFEPNIWYYISQRTNKVAYKNPKVQTREVVAITFGDDEKVAKVETYTLKDGYQIAYNGAETPTRGRELSVIEQLLGNIGRGGMMPQENDPGQRPGGR